MNLERLEQKLAQNGVSVTEEQLKALDDQIAFMLDKNEVMNLTAITEGQAIEDRHVVDSLVLANLPQTAGKVLDVGTGAGFPGVPIKILKPAVELTLLESVAKKVDFLKEQSQHLRLPYNVINARAEDASQNKMYREQFDFVTARAVAALNELCEYCLPFVKVGGTFAAMKGPGDEEANEARTAISALGGKWVETVEYTLPDGSERTLVLIEKIKNTPRRYPRSNAQIKRKPL